MAQVLDATYNMANQIERTMLWSEYTGSRETSPVLSHIAKQTVAHGLVHAAMAAVPLWILVAYFIR